MVLCSHPRWVEARALELVHVTTAMRYHLVILLRNEPYLLESWGPARMIYSVRHTAVINLLPATPHPHPHASALAARTFVYGSDTSSAGLKGLLALLVTAVVACLWHQGPRLRRALGVAAVQLHLYERVRLMPLQLMAA